MKVMKVGGPRQNLRTHDGSARRSRATDPNLILRPEFKGQPVVSLKISGNPETLTTSSGSIAQSIAINPSLIADFATRFSGFHEWRIVKTEVKIRNFSSSNAGLLNFWFSSENATPTSSSAINSRALRFNVSDITKDHILTYTPHDVEDQNWTSVGTAFTSGYMKIYTDNPNYGASMTATPLSILDTTHTVQFRGFART
jgi:hypothetical protein